MKIAFVHNDPRYASGTNFINKLIEKKLNERGIDTVAVYPDPDLFFHDFPASMRSALELMVFFSACRDKDKVMDCDFVYGTTYSAIAYLGYSKKIISHFGSTMAGIRNALTNDDSGDFGWFWDKIAAKEISNDINFDAVNNRFLNDLVDIEKYVAQKAAIVIAASSKVRNELIDHGVAAEKIGLIHNAIEDFWFETNPQPAEKAGDFGICYLGRIANGARDMKIKGIDRLAEIYKEFGDIRKVSIILARDEKVCRWMETEFKNHCLLKNLTKKEIKDNISKLREDALIMPSRYEGFSLTLIEGMSQGLIPVSFNIGIAAEVIENGNNGFIVESVKEMKEKINWLALNKGARKGMSRAAISSARKFTSEAITDKFINILNGVSN